MEPWKLLHLTIIVHLTPSLPPMKIPHKDNATSICPLRPSFIALGTDLLKTACFLIPFSFRLKWAAIIDCTQQGSSNWICIYHTVLLTSGGPDNGDLRLSSRPVSMYQSTTPASNISFTTMSGRGHIVQKYITHYTKPNTSRKLFSIEEVKKIKDLDLFR